MTQSMLQDENITARWRRSPWKEAADFLAGSRYNPEQFRALLKELYPQGGEIRVSQTHRGRAELHDFRGIDLTGRDLTGAYFDHFDLSGGVFRDTRVSRAHFDTAQIDGASFSGATAEAQVIFMSCFARHADFSRVRLYDARFSGADLSESNLTDATFERCDFSGALMDAANFSGVVMIDCEMQATRLSEREREADWLRTGTFRRLDHLIWVP